MRDVNRIDPFMNELAELWKTKAPDMRFAQFIANIWGEVGNKYGDPWFFEEDKMMQCIKEISWLQ